MNLTPGGITYVNGPMTAAEVRTRRDVALAALNAFRKDMDAEFRKNMALALAAPELTQRRVWRLFDRCCHQGRDNLPPISSYLHLLLNAAWVGIDTSEDQ